MEVISRCDGRKQSPIDYSELAAVVGAKNDHEGDGVGFSVDFSDAVAKS